jgi:hypothetical protein
MASFTLSSKSCNLNSHGNNTINIRKSRLILGGGAQILYFAHRKISACYGPDVTHVRIYKLDNKVESALVMNQSVIFEKFIVLILDVR